MKKIILHLAVILIMAITVTLATNVNAATTIIDSGKCGENATWTLESDGTFIISGEGSTRVYRDDDSNPPWYKHLEDIQTVRIEQGITSIGSQLFLFCTNLKEVYIPDSVTTIGYYAFDFVDNLTDIYFDNTETQWGKIKNYAKHTSHALKNATIHFSDIETKFSVNPEFLDGSWWNVLHVGFQDIDEEYYLILTAKKDEETIWTETKKLAKNQNYIQVGIPPEVLEEATVIKAFIWDNLESIRPLCPCKIVKPVKPN